MYKYLSILDLILNIVNVVYLKYLDKFGINYIVLDNLDIIIDRRYDINNYMKYLKLSYLYKILMVITK